MRTLFTCLVAFVACSRIGFAAEPAADTPEFFEKHIRPVLVEHCFECHSANENQLEGGLALDAAVGWQTGGDTGPAIIPGDPDRSLLLTALRFDGPEMPPDGRLPDPVIDNFRRWIEAGAVDPRNDPLPPLPTAKIDIEAGRKFWSFQSPKRFPIPAVHRKDWVRSDIDNFLLSQMEAAGVEPNASADPETRLRRLSLDLTGLPPSVELIAAFREDPSDAHWQKIVESLLTSRAYAEFWGRHWLDVVRYSDSNGSDFNATYANAWRYRNWVIQAMADDLPFDQFVRMQIAGDLLPAENDQQRTDNLVASTFLMLGPKMLSERDKAKLKMDIIDEQIDSIGKAFLGMTLGCARCHDHKFDPVPTEDYYALAGIFASTLSIQGEIQKYVSDWVETPLPVAPEITAAVEKHNAETKRLEAKVKQAKTDRASAQKTSETWNGIVLDDSMAERTGYWKESSLTAKFVGTGYIHDDNRNKGEASVLLRTTVPKSGDYRIRMSFGASANRASAAPLTIRQGERQEQFACDQRTAPEEGQWRTVGTCALVANEPIELTLSNQGTDGYVILDAIQLLLADQPVRTSEPSKDQTVLAQLDQAIKDAEEELKKHQALTPPAIPKAMAAKDLPTPEIGDACICIRGEVTNQGPKVPRGFLQVCSSNRPTIPEGESGRLQLADWLTDPDHPLVARVIVNRVWMHLAGEGLVRTVDNFGTQGESPSHPELLDTLAVQFIVEGWSIRDLVRRIVTSQFYQLSSQWNEQSAATDPENRLLWRFSRRRVPAESLRDTLLVAANMLDESVGHETMKGFGKLVDKNAGSTQVSIEATSRRTVYEPVVRNYLPPLLSAFDFADPDLIVGKRPVTNVPSQTLVLLNHPEVVSYVRKIATAIASHASDNGERIDAAYLRLLARHPTEEELTTAKEVLGNDLSTDSLETFVHALVASTPFRYLD